MDKIKRVMVVLLCVGAVMAASVPVAADTGSSGTIREKKVAVSLHSGDARGIAAEYGISERVTAGYGTGNGLFLKGFLLSGYLDVYAQISTGTSMLFRAGAEMNISSVFFGLEFASKNMSDSTSLAFGVFSGFVGIKF